jgi:hypothetical protein
VILVGLRWPASICQASDEEEEREGGELHGSILALRKPETSDRGRPQTYIPSRFDCGTALVSHCRTKKYKYTLISGEDGACTVGISTEFGRRFDNRSTWLCVVLECMVPPYRCGNPVYRARALIG